MSFFSHLILLSHTKKNYTDIICAERGGGARAATQVCPCIKTVLPVSAEYIYCYPEYFLRRQHFSACPNAKKHKKSLLLASTKTASTKFTHADICTQISFFFCIEKSGFDVCESNVAFCISHIHRYFSSSSAHIVCIPLHKQLIINIHIALVINHLIQ